MQSNLKIAITGGIGSGKSTVAKIISDNGYSVISCDEIYKQLLKDKNFLSKLCAEFGDILTNKGELDRKKLSDIVFNDKEKLKILNNLTHPQIMDKAVRRMENKGICFCEVPLLFEGGYERLFDKIIIVMRNTEDRIKSVIERNGADPISVQTRINSQFDYDNIEFAKYYVIHNNADFADLRLKTLDLLKQIEG